MFSVIIFTYSIGPNKVENIFKGSLDLIPSSSTSVKIQIIGGKVKRQNNTGHCQHTFESKKFVDISQPRFEFLLKVKVMGSNPSYLLKSFLLYHFTVATREKSDFFHFYALSM